MVCCSRYIVRFFPCTGCFRSFVVTLLGRRPIAVVHCEVRYLFGPCHVVFVNPLSRWLVAAGTWVFVWGSYIVSEVFHLFGPFDFVSFHSIGWMTCCRGALWTRIVKSFPCMGHFSSFLVTLLGGQPVALGTFWGLPRRMGHFSSFLVTPLCRWLVAVAIFWYLSMDHFSSFGITPLGGWLVTLDILLNLSLVMVISFRFVSCHPIGWMPCWRRYIVRSFGPAKCFLCSYHSPPADAHATRSLCLLVTNNRTEPLTKASPTPACAFSFHFLSLH